MKEVHSFDKVEQLNEINGEVYLPNGSTPLYDAMGFGINKVRHLLQNSKNYNVLVTILTDGEENASKEYKGQDIKALIEELKEQGWTFTYIGADHDVERFAISISIENTMRFSKNEADMKRMFDDEKQARACYSKKIRNKEDTKSDFYKK